MRKKDILERLENFSLDKDKYIIVGGASLVLNGVKRDCSNIDICCSVDTFNSIKDNFLLEKSIFNTDIKIDNDIIVGCDFFDLDRVVLVDGYNVANLESALLLRIKENREEDKKLIKKIQLIIDSSDNYKYERELIEKGVNFIAGVDEVGRGPLIGPVVTACVVLPHEFSLDGLTDSKKLNEKKRDYFYKEIKKQALGIGIGMCSAEEIDKYNIYEATKIAMKRAIEDCSKKCKIEHVLIDAMKLDLDIPTTSIIKGDLKSISISAASVIAKVTRDEMLYELDKMYPMYGFRENVGYPTKKHMEAIEEYGILKEHRKSFGPVKDYILRHGDKTID